MIGLGTDVVLTGLIRTIHVVGLLGAVSAIGKDIPITRLRSGQPMEEGGSGGSEF